ncbi:TPA: CylK protein, partial [Streptococcus agalactiae]|nr:CylK protein [Streptococcus agalactiae]
KLLFYKAWLQKEISYKCGKSIDITYQTMIDGYIYGYAFDNTFKVEAVYLKELLPDN